MNKLPVTMTREQISRGWIYLLVQQLLLSDILRLCNFLLGNPLEAAPLNFVFFGINFLVTTVFFHEMLIADGKRALSRPKDAVLYALAGLLGYFFLNLLVTMGILRIDPGFFNVNDSAIQTMAAKHYVLMFVGTVILVPVSEELLFRGVIFQSLYSRNRLLAYGLSCILFAMPHVIGYIGAYPPLRLLLCFVQYIPAGLCLGWTYVKSNTIFCPIIMHTAINLIGLLSMR